MTYKKLITQLPKELSLSDGNLVKFFLRGFRKKFTFSYSEKKEINI